jgi:GNAT superfamily N-acetyltransferase
MTDLHFTLRNATPADVSDVFRLVRGLAEHERLLDRLTATEADFAHALFGPRPLGEAMLAEVDGRAVGVAVWYYTFSTFTARPGMYLEDIFVEPDFRGRGIGLAMFRRLAASARDRNCWSMEWSVLNWNQPAIDFYLHIGARPVTDWTLQRLDATAIAALADI